MSGRLGPLALSCGGCDDCSGGCLLFSYRYGFLPLLTPACFAQIRGMQADCRCCFTGFLLRFGLLALEF